MKKEIFIMFIILSLIGLLHSQELFEQIKLNGPIGPDLPQYHVRSQSLIETYDGGYLVVSSCAEDSEYLPFTSMFEVLSKYSINGELLWCKEFDKALKIMALTELKDGSIICTGGIYKESLLPWVWAVFKLNPCGEVEWGKQIDHSKHLNKEYLTDNALDVGDGIIITALKFYDEVTNPRDRIKSEYVKLDYDGNFLWRRDLNFGYNNHQTINGSCLDRDGNIILTGQVTVPAPWAIPGSNLATVGTFIAKTDTEGKVVFHKHSAKSFKIYDIASDAPVVDNDNIVYSTTREGVYSNDDRTGRRSFAPLYVSDTKADTTYTYEIKCEGAIPAEQMYVRFVFPFSMIDDYEHIVTGVAFKNKEEELSDKKINEYDGGNLFREFAGRNMKTNNVFKSERDNSGNEETVRLLIIDKKANELLRLDIPPEKGFMEAVVTTKDNNIVVLNNNPDANDRYADSYLMKYTNKLTPALINNEDIKYDTYCDRKIESGYVKVNFDDLIIDEVQEIKENICNLRLSPNPATDNVTVYFPQINGDTVLYIYDLSGQKVQETLCDKDCEFININISNLKSGLYFVKLTVDGLQNGVAKLIVR